MARYRLTVNQTGMGHFILEKVLPSSQSSYKLTRKFLLSHTVRTRGDMRPKLFKYRVRIEALRSEWRFEIDLHIAHR